MTSRLGTGKWLTFFYSVTHISPSWHWQLFYPHSVFHEQQELPNFNSQDLTKRKFSTFMKIRILFRIFSFSIFTSFSRKLDFKVRHYSQREHGSDFFFIFIYSTSMAFEFISNWTSSTRTVDVYGVNRLSFVLYRRVAIPLTAYTRSQFFPQRLSNCFHRGVDTSRWPPNRSSA